MKKIKIKLEYQCFPVWIYDDNDNLLDNELPDELIGDDEVDLLCVILQEEFDLLYINDGNEFKYVGFQDTFSRNEFIKKADKVIQIIEKKVGGKYDVNNNVDIEKL